MGKPKDIVDIKPTFGEKVRFVGVAGQEFTCPVCKVRKKRAMVSEYKRKLFCGENCIIMSRHVGD